MTERIRRICSFLDPCDRFCDLGCDHGYAAEYMLRGNLCKRALVTDISADSLKKAETLLGDYIAEGRCESLCADGLDGIEGCDLVLAAGFGGREIARILERGYIPERFVFQPMKNAEILRDYLYRNGAKVERDTVFCVRGKYYPVIKGTRGGGDFIYSRLDVLFGKERETDEVRDYLRYLEEKTRRHLAQISDKNKRMKLEVELMDICEAQK